MQRDVCVITLVCLYEDDMHTACRRDLPYLVYQRRCGTPTILGRYNR